MTLRTHFARIAALITLFAFSISIAFAQPTSTNGNAGNSLNSIITWFLSLVNTLVPVVFALAFIFFLFGVFKYFFSSGTNADEKRQEGKKFILWGVIALAVMVCVWGLVNVLVNTFPGLNKARPDLPCFDRNCNSTTPTPGT